MNYMIQMFHYLIQFSDNQTNFYLIDSNLDPPRSFSERQPKLGFPGFQQIFDHLCYLSLEVSLSDDNENWISQNADKYIIKSTKAIYTYLNECLKTGKDVNVIE